jgi:hypothetical protein
MYIALEIGIGGGALISAAIYQNNPANFVYAFALPGFLALVTSILLYNWHKQAATKA